MQQPERDPAFTARDQRVYKGMRTWASSHTNDIIDLLDYNPTNPNQFVERALLEAEPDLEKARLFGSLGMGAQAYDKIVGDFKRLGVIDLARENASAPHPTSTLFATLHVHDTLDTALTHNAAFAAADGDPEFAEMNVVLANYIMMAMTVGGYAVDRALVKSGKQIRVLPDKALKYIDREDYDFINRIALPAFNHLLKRGVAIHQAPSATRALKGEIVHSGEEVRVVPRVEDGAAGTIIKKSPDVVGVPMNVKPGDSQAVVFEPRRITSAGELHDLMNEMVEEVNVLTDTLVIYGLREGIRLLDDEEQQLIDAA
ncbi:MAG TPA: hypothetical protein VG964_03175 [Candidatus Saccharimonadales bacterium]|nr:hypothetical protein [Candidatus Saccharimonadales bacterium]